jgi:predicted transcriptional regulator
MNPSTIGDQELELLRFVTEHAPISVREATETYGEAHGLARTTILTVMERLRKKGYLTRRKEQGVNVYSPRLSQAEVLRGLVGQFVEKTLGGSLSPFVAYLAEAEGLSQRELAELRRLLDRLPPEPEEDRDA